MLTKFKHWLKWKLAGDELKELYRIKTRAEETRVWCSHIPLVTDTAEYILSGKDAYPYQSLGYHGSIEDFRRYVEKREKGEDSSNGN